MEAKPFKGDKKEKRFFQGDHFKRGIIKERRSEKEEGGNPQKFKGGTTPHRRTPGGQSKLI